jgi:hypothetical protein
MIDFEFRPVSYFEGTGPEVMLAKLSYPESTWGDEICLYATVIDGEIHFEAVDFYGNDIHLFPPKSAQPLRLQELILMVERMEVSPSHAIGGIEFTLAGIPCAESYIYKDLEPFFAAKRAHFGFH